MGELQAGEGGRRAAAPVLQASTGARGRRLGRIDMSPATCLITLITHEYSLSRLCQGMPWQHLRQPCVAGQV